MGVRISTQKLEGNTNVWPVKSLGLARSWLPQIKMKKKYSYETCTILALETLLAVFPSIRRNRAEAQFIRICHHPLISWRLIMADQRTGQKGSP